MPIETATERPPMTPAQKRVYDYIRNFWLEHGGAPTLREISAGLGINSAIAGIRAHCVNLATAGWLKALKYGEGESSTRYCPAEVELVVTVLSNRVHVGLTGPGDCVPLALWREWLRKCLDELEDHPRHKVRLVPPEQVESHLAEQRKRRGY